MRKYIYLQWACKECIAFGPGENGDMFESTQIIGDQQFRHAMDLMSMSQSSQEIISGAVDYRHAYVKMKGLNVTTSTGHQTALCSPAMGYAFAAGTTDGPVSFITLFPIVYSSILNTHFCS